MNDIVMGKNSSCTIAKKHKQSKKTKMKYINKNYEYNSIEKVSDRGYGRPQQRMLGVNVQGSELASLHTEYYGLQVSTSS